MIRKRVILAAALKFLLLVMWVRPEAGTAGERTLAFDPTVYASDNTQQADSTFLSHYSQVLGITLDSGCNTKLIATIADWIGVRYQRGGYSKSGIDCSGFVSKIYSLVFERDLTHSSSAMIHQMKERVKRNEMKEGDIVFFRINSSQISHVGLYLSNDKFVHASIYRGIVIDDLNEPYYTRYYYGGGRVL